MGDEPKDEPIPLGQVLRVAAVDDGGRSLRNADIRWYDEAGRELGRGRDLRLSTVGVGEQVVHAVATLTGGKPLTRTFVLRKAESPEPCHLIASRAVELRADAPTHLHAEGETHDH